MSTNLPPFAARFALPKRFQPRPLAIALGSVAITASLSACSGYPLGEWLLSDETEASVVETQQLQLFDSKGTSYSLDQLPQAIDAALALGPNPERLTLFIHGMGPYPQKAFDDKELDGIANTFDTGVLMLGWPSWKGSWLKMPRLSAQSTGRALVGFWDDVESWRATKIGTDTELALIAHSMGSEVMHGISEQPQAQLFDVALVAAPETPLIGHAQWLQNITLAKRKAVLINPTDKVIAAPAISTGSKRLGMGIQISKTETEALAKDTIYLIIKGMSFSHTLHYNAKSDSVRKLLSDVFNHNSLDQYSAEIINDATVITLED